MSEELTIKGIAERLQPDPELRPQTLRRLRHWTRLDLLAPFGEKRSGSGRWLVYPPETVQVAAVLDYMMPLGLDVSVQRRIVMMMWFALGHPRGMVPVPDGIAERIIMMVQATDGTRDVYITASHEAVAMDHEPFPKEGWPDAGAAAVVINLTKIFDQLR